MMLKSTSLSKTADPIPPRADNPYHLTDLGNARRLVDLHSRDILYVPQWGYIVWDGKRWTRDGTGEVYRRAKDTVRLMYRDAARSHEESERKKIAQHAGRSESERSLRAMVNLASTEPEIATTPDSFDRASLLLSVNNGTIDLRTGKLGEHRREHLITKLAPVEFDPEAKAPTWDTFLDRIFDSNTDLIQFCQRAVGYSLTGETDEQVLFIYYGGGANGKSTKLETIATMLGDYAIHAAANTLMAQHSDKIPNDVARLKGGRLVIATETEDNRRLSEALVKSLTGGDVIAARFLRREFFEFKPACKVFLATNHKPIIRGSDNAIWRRIRLVPFRVTIPEEEQDHTLGKKLRTEFPGILAWAVRGCLEWQQHGLGTPNDVANAVSEYRAEMDMLADFLADRTKMIDSAQTPKDCLYKAYVNWCETNGERSMTSKMFGTRLKEKGFTDGRRKNQRFWNGVGLLEE